MKYICMEQSDGKQEIFTFPHSVTHDVMAEVLERMKNQTHGSWERLWREPISAGFVDAKGNCFGRSETLNLDARMGKDTELLKQQYNL